MTRSLRSPSRTLVNAAALAALAQSAAPPSAGTSRMRFGTSVAFGNHRTGTVAGNDSGVGVS